MTERISNFQVQQNQIVLGTSRNRVVLLCAQTTEVLWEQPPSSKITAAPAFADEAIIVGSYNGSPHDVHTLSSLHRESGQQHWCKEGSGAFWRPRYRNGVVYTGSTDQNLYAIDVGTGDVKWSCETSSALSPQIAIGKDTVHCATQGKILVRPSVPRTVYAIDMESGEKLWSYDNKKRWLPELFQTAKLFHSPLFFEDKVYLTAGSELWVFHSRTGKKHLVKDMELNHFLQPFHSQCINEQHLCLSSPHASEIIVVTPEKADILLRVKASSYAVALHDSTLYWSDHDGTFHALDIDTSTEKWVITFPKEMFCSPIVEGKRMYAGLNETLYCIDIETGQTLWRYSLPSEQIES